MTEIKNLPLYHQRYVVARNVEGDYWFWGSWSEERPAYEAAHRINGFVFEIDPDDYEFELWVEERLKCAEV